MPLNTLKLKEDLLELQQDLSTAEDPEAAAEQWATRLSAILTAFVRTGQVNTTGSAAAQTGTIL